MKKANRKYQVPRSVQKERMELFWCSLFRVRLFISKEFGYDPVLYNFDQSPYHHNESGSQNKATLSVRGANVPIVEGTADIRERWTLNATTCSNFSAVAENGMPWAECMFKGTPGKMLHENLTAFRVRAGFPDWFTVTISEKGSYREHDIIEFLTKHLEEWRDGRDWRILMADDYSAHKTPNVRRLCWRRGYILILHGGGCTPIAQTPDTDLNEHIRREYGMREATLLMEKSRMGITVPRLDREECMTAMFRVLNNPELHKRAERGYKQVGQSIDLWGSEDNMITREAKQFFSKKRPTDIRQCVSA